MLDLSRPSIRLLYPMLTRFDTIPPGDRIYFFDYITNEDGLTAQVKNDKVTASEHVEDWLGHEIEGETIKENVGNILMGETTCD